MDINEIIEKIKAAIPFLNKGEEEEEEVTGEHEIESEEGVETSGEEDEEEEIDEKAQKRSKIIKGIAAVVVAWVAIDEFVLKKEAPPPTPPQVQKKQRPVKKNIPKKKVLEEEQPQEEVIAVPERTPEPTPGVETPEEEPAVMADTSEPEPEPEREAEPDPTPTEDGAETVSVPEVTPEPVAEAEPREESNPVGGFVGGESAEGETEVVSKPGEGEVNEALNNLVTNMDASKLEEKIASPKMEYVAPPDYESLGRGLVYNCKGKHWACVDKRSYFECRDNYTWAKENNKASECVTQPVYASYEDCRTIQKYYVNTNQKTDFCK